MESPWASQSRGHAARVKSEALLLLLGLQTMSRSAGTPIGRQRRNREVEWDPETGRTWRVSVGLEPDLGGQVKPLVEARPISASGVINQTMRMVLEDPELRARLLERLPKAEGPEQLHIDERKAS